MWWTNAADYIYQWWADGLRAPDQIFNIQSSRYGLSFDFRNFRLRKFGVIEKSPTEAEALRLDNSLIESLPEVLIEAALVHQGQRNGIIGAGRSFEDCQLVESGKYFQRRWLTYLVFEPGLLALDARESGLEIAAWPDRVAFILRLIAKEPIGGSGLEMTFKLPAPYSNFQDGDVTGSLYDDRGRGFVFLGSSTESNLSFDPERRTCTASMKIEDWLAGEERALGMIVYPRMDAQNTMAEVADLETSPVDVQAVQVQPEQHDLAVTYQREQGWYSIGLRNDGDTSDYSETSNDRIERVKITIHNPSQSPRPVHLSFAKDERVFGITGISAVLRDLEGNPLGLPVQLSKNWHNGALDQSRRFQGPWFHGFSMITVPGGQKVEFEYTSVNALWGTLPAASHAQLCLVGWGSNQLWDQAAIGSWGENLCFEPDQGQVGGAVLDTRPLMVWGMGQEPRKKWGWTNNVGGADFLVYYDKNVEKQWNSRMRTRYRRHGPNLTEVTYAGTTYDRKIGLEYTVSLYRTDDITRGVYRFRYDVREQVEFSKLVLFQCGSYDYSYTGERKFAYGNEKGLVKEWETQWGGFTYRTDRMRLVGKTPWVSMHDAVSRDTGFGAWANRGIVVRKWEARLGGKGADPWIAEVGALVRGSDTSLVDFLPPPGVEQLLPGDYVEAEVVHVVVPQFAADYYGPNENLRSALEAGENTWKMIHREALGNFLEVKVNRGGKLVRTYPIQIHSQGGEIAFTVTGGLGYAPVTFTGLGDYRGYKLEQKLKGAWVEMNQSHYGKDFWQVDFEPEGQSWELTYNLPLDTPEDARTRQEFRLSRKSP